MLLRRLLLQKNPDIFSLENVLLDQIDDTQFFSGVFVEWKQVKPASFQLKSGRSARACYLVIWGVPQRHRQTV